MQEHFDATLAIFSNFVLFTNTAPPSPSLNSALFTGEPLHFAQSLFNNLVVFPSAGACGGVVFPCPGIVFWWLKSDFRDLCSPGGSSQPALHCGLGTVLPPGMFNTIPGHKAKRSSSGVNPSSPGLIWKFPPPSALSVLALGHCQGIPEPSSEEVPGQYQMKRKYLKSFPKD